MTIHNLLKEKTQRKIFWNQDELINILGILIASENKKTGTVSRKVCLSMPIGEFRAWARLKLAYLIGNEEFLDDAQRRMDEYHSGQLRRGERWYSYRLAQLEGFYHYNALPMLPNEMPEEEAFYDTPKDKCRYMFHGVDDCLFKWSQKDRTNYRLYHTRVHSCRRPWELFMKCCVARDIKILRNIESWEKYYLKKMKTDEERQAYVDALQTKSQYYDYMYKITDPDKRISCYYEKRQKEHQRRLNNLLNTLDGLRGLPRDITRPKIKKPADVTRGHYVITQR